MRQPVMLLDHVSIADRDTDHWSDAIQVFGTDKVLYIQHNLCTIVDTTATPIPVEVEIFASLDGKQWASISSTITCAGTSELPDPPTSPMVALPHLTIIDPVAVPRLAYEYRYFRLRYRATTTDPVAPSNTISASLA